MRRNFWLYLSGLLALALAVFLRLISIGVVTSDFTYFLEPWYAALQSHPWLTAFAQPFADYAPLYLYMLKALGLLGIPSLLAVKSISIFFDVCLAVSSCLVLRALVPGISRARLFFSFALMLLVPTFILNSALWGQSDSIYATFVVLSLYFMLSDSPLLVGLAFAIAFSIKFQAIFFAPVVVGYLLRREESVRWLLLPPLLYAASVIPAILSGGSALYWLFVYTKEATEYTALSLSSQSVFALVSPLPLSSTVAASLFWAGILGALLIAGIVVILIARAGASAPERVLLISLLCVLVLPYLLPRMHERYFYLADALSMLAALARPRWFLLPLLCVGASLLSYMHYLSQVPLFAPFVFDLRIPSMFLLVALSFCIALLWYLPERSSARAQV